MEKLESGHMGGKRELKASVILSFHSENGV